MLPQVEAQTGQGGWRLLSKWPELHKGGATTMDEAQAAALRVALTKEVAIVSGGPATGKQYLSRVILRALLDNRGKRGDGAAKPVLLVSPASHTLDRALSGVVGFEPNVVRVASTRAEGLKAHNLSAKVREVKGDDAHAAAVAKVSKKQASYHHDLTRGVPLTHPTTLTASLPLNTGEPARVDRGSTVSPPAAGADC